MSWWIIGRIKELSTPRIMTWGAAKFLFGLGLGLLLTTYLQTDVSVSAWQVSGWVLIIVSAVMGLGAMYPIFKNRSA